MKLLACSPEKVNFSADLPRDFFGVAAWWAIFGEFQWCPRTASEETKFEKSSKSSGTNSEQ